MQKSKGCSWRIIIVDIGLDENAANPHGGTDGAKILEEQTFVLIDVG